EMQSLYHGAFLSGNNASDWILEERENLQHAYLEGLRLMASFYVGLQEYRAALDAYAAIIATDPLQEAAHRGIIQCLVHLGEKSQAIRHYQMLCQRLDEELGAVPDPQTSAMLEG